jgi:hypothetical protein
LGLLLVIAGAAAFAGCGSGDIASASLPEAQPPAAVQNVTDTPTPEDCIEPACQDFPLPKTPHAVRLTSAQWERTIQDLLELSAAPGSSVDFPSDPASSPDRFGSEAGDLIVTTQHWAAYQKAAESLAALVTGDSASLDKILPVAAKSGDTNARVAAFVADFLPRAYRREVTAKEIVDVIAAGESAAANVSSGDPFIVRVKWILTAILQSPKLIYRITFGDDASAKDGRARLTAYEIAAKLSYGLWGTMPDGALVAQAKAGKLATKQGVAEVARGMLADPRAAVAMLAFHDQLYLVDHYPDVKNRPADLFPKFYPGLMTDAQQDVRLTVDDLIIKHDGGVKELTTSNVAYVDAQLAKVYGIDESKYPALKTSPNAFTRVELDPTQRKGILMHAGWLTYEGSPKDPSPIHRGAFVARHVICSPLGSPPPGAAGAMPEKSPQPTNRLRVEETTKGCGDGCHGGKGGVINPLGFSFEGFDSIGQLRTKDGDQPVDTKGETALIGKFDGAIALFDTVSTSARAHACYAAHWSSYLNGSSLVDVTPRWLSPAVAKSLKNGSVRDIVVELVQTDAFLTVSR